MAELNTLPKVLIVSRLVWDDNSSSNTLTNLFEDYDPDKIARIYIETIPPRTKCCHLFYQISEYSLIKRLFNRHVVTGRVIDSHNVVYDDNTQQKTIARDEQSIMSFVRSHRSWVFTYLRELLWAFGGWKTKELKNFVLKFDPDVVWLDGSPLILMNKLNNYIIKIANKPSVTFLMDDVYRYNSNSGIMNKLYKFFLRKHVKRTVDQSQHVFVSSPKMAQVYDQIFNTQSTFIAKSFNTTSIVPEKYPSDKKSVKLIYLGNVLIGRFDTLTILAECINDVNSDGIRIELVVYSNSVISEKSKSRFAKNRGVKLLPPVPYSQVPDLIKQSDVQVFVEDMEGRHKSTASLSFSTKIVDYLSSGKCILALGPKDIAPIEYFMNEDAALVANSRAEVTECLKKLCDPVVLNTYSAKAVACAKRNHDREMMDDRIYGTLNSVAKTYSST